MVFAGWVGASCGKRFPTSCVSAAATSFDKLVSAVFSYRQASLLCGVQILLVESLSIGGLVVGGYVDLCLRVDAFLC